jgi:flagellar hook assembly protein FlgD
VASPETIPGHYNLSYNYPNPFNPKTTINFSNPTSEFVSVNVYDINGTEIITLISETLSNGEHSVEWNGADYPSGIYIARISSGNYFQKRKMLLIK